jgi:molybdopterin converting factor small subunit
MVKDILGQINLAEHFAGLILINGRKGKMSGVLQQGDVLTVFPLVAGG